jgi:hypothetical protein
MSSQWVYLVVRPPCAAYIATTFESPLSCASPARSPLTYGRSWCPPWTPAYSARPPIAPVVLGTTTSAVDLACWGRGLRVSVRYNSVYRQRRVLARGETGAQRTQGAPKKRIKKKEEPVGCFYVGLRFFGLFCKVLLRVILTPPARYQHPHDANNPQPPSRSLGQL